MSTELTPEQEKIVQERVNDETHKALDWAFKLMKEHYGEEVYQVLKKSHAEHIRLRFSKLAEEGGDTSIEAFAKHIWEELPKMGFEYTQEKTDSGIQMKCTKCPPADMAKRLGITEMMFYLCCEQDHFMPDGFNPNIGFKRTKTLMQGDDCCDHYYYYKDKKQGEKIISTTKSIEDEVKDAIKNFTEALNTPGDADRFKNAFHSNARIYHFSLGTDKSIPSGDYCERSATAPEEEFEAIETVLLDITGDAAFAIVEWRHPAGRRPQNRPECIFIDYYPLLKVDNEWKVTSLTDEVKREGIIPDEDGVNKTLRNFYNGFDSRDYDLMKTSFHNDFRAFGNDDDFKKGIDLNKWCNILSGQSPETFERETLISVIDDTIAFAKVKWRGLVHSFMDYYTFTLVNGSWIITTRTFSI